MRLTPIEFEINPREKTYWMGIFTAYLQNGNFRFLEIGWQKGRFVYLLISYDTEFF